MNQAAEAMKGAFANVRKINGGLSADQLIGRNPDWAVQFDMNADVAREVRRKTFAMMVSERMIVGGFHFPFPAFGRIEKMRNGFDFKPVA